MRNALVAMSLLLSACATTTGATLEDCLRDSATAHHADSTWSDPMDSLITAAIDARRESFYCPSPRPEVAGL